MFQARGVLVGACAFLTGLLMCAVFSVQARADFGIQTFTAQPMANTFTPDPLTAGGHPDLHTRLTFNLCGDAPGIGCGMARSMRVDLPDGVVIDASAIPACDRQTALSNERCPDETAVGTGQIWLGANPGPVALSLYNMEPAADEAGTVLIKLGPLGGTSPLGVMKGISTPADGNRIQAFAPEIYTAGETRELEVRIWGVPADSARQWPTFLFPLPASVPRRSFVSSPTSCHRDPVTNVWIDSYESPETFMTASDTTVGGHGCEDLEFEPEVEVKPTGSRAADPTGLVAKLGFEQTDDPTQLVPAHLKKATVTLPQGMAISPSSAQGLSACSSAEIGIGNDRAVRCPEASKIATVDVETHLLDEPLAGSVYLASQFDNPFNSLLAVYIVAEGPGVLLKLPGRVDTDPNTGQITAVFDNNPQLPFTDMRIRFKDGPRAPLMLPKQCGSYEIVSEFVPWSAEDPDNPRPDEVERRVSRFTVDRGCMNSAGFAPGFDAGTSNPVAGAHSPFSMRLTRGPLEQEISSVELDMPKGLLAKIAGVPLCDSAAADAGACGEGSRIGHVQVASGAGPVPVWIPQAGKTPTAVYLSGPYRGAPYSLSIVVPAQAGPFDLGRVVVRAAIQVDERTADLSVPIVESRVFSPSGALTSVVPGGMPRILEGIPLNVREIRVLMDRPEFMLNPTNCAEQQVAGTVTSTLNTVVGVSNRFQVGDCASLGFAPRFRAQILDRGRRSTLRSWHPRTRFAVVPRAGDANIDAARVALPSSTILDQANIGTTCTRADMAARDCPERSIVGYARAWSPLLNRPVQGPVYLAANGGVRPLPDLAAVLDGEIRIVLLGEISTLRSRGKARLQNTFRVVPDAPVSRFILTMRGGRDRGLLVNSTDLCRTNERGVALFRGQNGRMQRLRPRLGLTFKGCRKARRQMARRVAKRKAAAQRSAALRSPSGSVGGRR